MGRFVQQVGKRSSLKWIRQPVNHYASVLDRHLHAAGVTGQVRWLSPLLDDHMAEYRENHFLHRIEGDKHALLGWLVT